MRLTEPIKASGYFWLPDKPEQRLPGTLSVTAEGKISLELLGCFDDSPTQPILSLTQFRLAGHIESGQLVTLDQCIIGGIKSHSSGIETTAIKSLFMLVGAAYKLDVPINLSRIQFSVEGLDEWLQSVGYKTALTDKPAGGTITYLRPPETTFNLAGGISFSIAYDWSLVSMRAGTEAKVTQKAFIVLTAQDAQRVQFWQVLVHKLNNFFCFAMDQTVTVNSIEVFTNDVAEEVPTGTRQLPLKLIYQSWPTRETPPKLHWYEMLFQFKDVETDLERILVNWLENYEISEPAFSLYFSTRSSQSFVDGLFLALAQGIETLHRRNNSESHMPFLEFETLVKALIETCPSHRKEWLEQRLTYANELSLRTRLRAMLAPFPHLFGDKESQKQFVHTVTNTRNYLTHYDPELKSQAATGDALWFLYQKLEALFELHFLRLVGLDPPAIDRIVQNSLNLRHKLTRVDALGKDE